MSFLSVAHTDVGIRKKTNQDSVLIKEAFTDYGEVLLAVVCDGMGGLAKGELASAALIRTFSDWFENEFPQILYERRDESGVDRSYLEGEMNRLVLETNERISGYGLQNHVTMGTTVALILFVEGMYYITNVGDSRVYRFTDRDIRLLTTDQTFVQREVDEGRMTEEEAKVHPQRNMLLQCVGASEIIIPEFECGEYTPGEVYMICSDGFRHLITEQEFCKLVNPKSLSGEEDLKNVAVYCTELNKQRAEKDNISVILIKVN